MEMKKCLIRLIAFTVCFMILLQLFQFVLQAKWYNDSNSYARIKLFYQEDHAPDVVFFGSSQIYYQVNPLLMFREEGFTSYDFSPPGEGGEGTVLYVKEAIKEYHPKVIVIDVRVFIRLMMNESRSHQWLDALPLSIDKLLTARAIMKNNERFDFGIEYGSLLSYAYPILRYHDRWKELTEKDFTLDQKVAYYHGAVHYHGYGTHYQVTSVDFSHYFDSVIFDDAVVQQLKQIFAETVALCQKSGTELLLIKAPYTGWRQDYHDLISAWSDEYGVKFIDYNDKIDELNLDLEIDFKDINHLNDNGATKFSRELGRYLKQQYSLPDHRDDLAYTSWDDDWQVYQQDRAAYYLSHETDWISYLEKLQNPNYTIYMAARDSLGGDKHPELTMRLKSLGLTPNLESAAHMGYLAIIDRGKIVYEHLKDEPIAYETNVNGHTVSLISESYLHGNRASITLNYAERFVNRRGLGIVVYDNLLDDVVDCVTFDLWDGGKAYR